MLDTNQWSATVGATDQIVLGTNLGRKRITLSAPSAGRITFAFGRAAVLDQGITMQVGNTPRTITDEDVGYNIRGDVHAIADAAGRVTGGTESFKAFS